MSGKGERFSHGGYKDPKPLIQIGEKMMFEYSIDHFSYPDNYIFVVSKEISENPKFLDFVSKFNNDYEIIVHEKVTNGQATSLYLAVKDLISKDGFFVSSCDLSFTKIVNISTDKNIIFTTNPKEHHIKNSGQYGWVEHHENQSTVSCKKMPNTKNNLSIITGCFYFKSLQDFKIAYKNMVEAGSTINNEYYLDNIFNFEPLNLDTLTFQVDEYRSFGSPKEIN